MKKEFREILRTYKIYVIPGIFAFFGLMSPLIAKILPEMLKSMAQGFTFTVPAPRAIDAYAQLFKNLNQMGLLAVIFTSVGLMADERNRGTVILMATKPIPRWSIVISKYLGASALVLASTFLSYILCMYYTQIIFKDAMFQQSVQAVVMSAAYFLLVLALTLLASTVSKNIALSGGIAMGGLIILAILPVLHPWLKSHSPNALLEYQNGLLTGGARLADTWPALLIALSLAALLVGAAVFIFNQQEL